MINVNTETKVYKVYCLYSTKDYCVKYIGITYKKLKRRLDEHLSDARCKAKTHKEKWIKKSLQDNFNIRIKLVNKTSDLEEVKKLEIYFIEKCRLRNYQLVNGTSGGDGVFNLSEDIKKKLSERYKGKPMHTAETRLKMSIAKKGKPSNQRRAVVQLTIAGELVAEYPSLKAAGTAHKVCSSTIHAYINKQTKKQQKYLWKYK